MTFGIHKFNNVKEALGEKSTILSIVCFYGHRVKAMVVFNVKIYHSKTSMLYRWALGGKGRNFSG